MTDPSCDQVPSEAVALHPESAQPASSRSRFIASAIALLSSAALVIWAAMHSQI